MRSEDLYLGLAVELVSEVLVLALGLHQRQLGLGQLQLQLLDAVQRQAERAAALVRGLVGA